MNLEKYTNDFQSLVYRIRTDSAPAYPEYASFQSRLKTYKNFPGNSFQNKYNLSECGLKYSGVEDIVECFYCGLILHDWEKLDNPWIEHCRYNPKCIYVLLMRGNQFVQKILAKYCKPEHICENVSYDTVC